MNVHPLSRLLTDGQATTSPVALCGGEVVDFARFHTDVAGNAARLARAGCRRGLLVT